MHKEPVRILPQSEKKAGLCKSNTEEEQNDLIDILTKGFFGAKLAMRTRIRGVYVRI